MGRTKKKKVISKRSIQKNNYNPNTYKSDVENFTLQLFTSSIEELTTGGGVSGIYATILLKRSKPLRLGVGIIYDLNQFSNVPDSVWQGVDRSTRYISGYQFSLTHELQSGLLNDTYLFTEFTVLSYPEDLTYVRNQQSNKFEETTEEGEDIGDNSQGKRGGIDEKIVVNSGKTDQIEFKNAFDVFKFEGRRWNFLKSMKSFPFVMMILLVIGKVSWWLSLTDEEMRSWIGVMSIFPYGL